MRVTVDICVIADRHVVADDDPAAIVEEYVAVDDNVVTDLHVVAEGEFHVVERLEVLATALEDVAREQSAQLDAEPHVLSPRRRSIEGIPEPQQRLHALKARVA